MSLSNLPSLLYRRSTGRTRSGVFRDEISLSKSQLSMLDHAWVASPHVGEIPALCVDRIEGRFLLSGASDATVSIYDFSKWGTEAHLQGKRFSRGRHVYKPVARSVRVPFGGPHEVPRGHSHAVVAVQWYAVDTGAFLSASADGSILVWDTHSMGPVFRWSPFESISCMHLSTSSGRSDSLLSVGSFDDPFVKLIDIRTGASSHSLVGHEKGITCLEWSPTSDVTVASGSLDGGIRIWDIRKSGSRSCVTVLDRDQSMDPARCKPFHPCYSHLSRQRKTKASPNNSQQDVTHGIVSHSGAASAISFDNSGSFFVSTGMDGKIQAWDLRGNGHLLPLSFSSRLNQPAVSRTRKQVPMVLQSIGKDTIAWVGYGSQVLGYNVQRGGCPAQVLEGHMQVVTALERVDHLLQLFSGAADGMILGWASPPVDETPLKRGARRDANINEGSKRIRAIDRDSW